MLIYNPPDGSYIPRIPPGTAALRDILAAHFSITRVEVIRGKSRCTAERSEHCECRGVDFFTTDLAKLRAIFDFCVTHAEALGIQSVIANRRVWGFGDWRERAYDGPSPHTDHAHIGLTRHAAQHLTEGLIRSLLTEEEEEVRYRDLEGNEYVDVLPWPDGTGLWGLKQDGGIVTLRAGKPVTGPGIPFYGAYAKGNAEGWKALKLEPFMGGYLFITDRCQTYHFGKK